MAPPYIVEETACLGPQRAFWTALDPATNTYPVREGWDRVVPDMAGMLLCPFYVLLSPLGGLEDLWGAEQHSIRLGRVEMGPTVLLCPSVSNKSTSRLKESKEPFLQSQVTFALSSRAYRLGLFRVSFAKSISIKKKFFFLKPLHLTPYCLHKS